MGGNPSDGAGTPEGRQLTPPDPAATFTGAGRFHPLRGHQMSRAPIRPILLGTAVAVALVAGAAALLTRRADAVPVTVYLTPT